MPMAEGSPLDLAPYVFVIGTACTLEMAHVVNSPVFGPSSNVLKQSASNFLAMTSFRADAVLLAKNFCFLQSFII